MASDARLSVGLPGHPKTKKLVRRGGTEAAWHLVCLFLWAAQNRSDGDLTGLSDEDIELAADWPGHEGSFVSMLSEVGFLDGEEGAYKIHDWAEHNPWAAGANDRSEASKWAALCKRYGREGAAQRMPEYADRMRQDSEPYAEPCEPHATGTNPQCGSDAPSPSPSPLPIPFPSQDQPIPVDSKPSTAICPHQEIIALYHEYCPTGTMVRVWNETRSRHLQARWREDPKRQDLEWWRSFFQYCADSPFLSSRIPPRQGHKQFVIALDWIVNPTNFAKIVEGKYHEESAA